MGSQKWKKLVLERQANPETTAGELRHSLDRSLSELSALSLASIGLKCFLCSSSFFSFLLALNTEPQAFPAGPALVHWIYQPLFYILFWGRVLWSFKAGHENHPVAKEILKLTILLPQMPRNCKWLHIQDCGTRPGHGPVLFLLSVSVILKNSGKNKT